MDPALQEAMNAEDREAWQRAYESWLISRSLEAMSLEEKVGQLLLVQYRYLEDGSPLRILGTAESDEIRGLKPGGFMLFGENIHDPEQAIRLIRDLKEAAGPFPPLIAVDQEGGLVDRLDDGPTGATRFPSAQEMARRGEEAVYASGLVMARELAVLGFTMNFAPVADIGGPGSFIGSRAFSNDAQLTSRMVEAFTRGTIEGGLAPVLKHFPGLGNSEVDTHRELQVRSESLAELEAWDFLPFRQGISSGAAAIMLGHVAIPELDESGLPASLSPKILSYLREEMGFDGLIITDALEMRGLRQVVDPDKAAAMAIIAGADMVLTPTDPWPSRVALLEALQSGELSQERLNLSVKRILRLKLRWPGSGWKYAFLEDQLAEALLVLGRQEHLEMRDSFLNPSGL